MAKAKVLKAKVKVKKVVKVKKGGNTEPQEIKKIDRQDPTFLSNLKKYGIPIFLGIAAYNVVDSFLDQNPRLFR